MPSEKPFLQTLNGAILDVPPSWLMREAGRYLPEYRDLVGFVFSSRRDIKIAEVVALAPKLVALVRGVL